MAWTQRDEQELKSLCERVHRLQAERAQEVKMLAALVRNVIAQGWKADEVDRLVSALIDHADGFRDALAPFDSGIRAERPAPTLPRPPWSEGGGD
jgi:hypothetical protein